MKKHLSEFVRRGLTACGIGPIVLAILYLILQQQGLVGTLTVNEVCLGILSLSALAFIAGGMNFIYQIEQLPLLLAILIHGIVLYISYLITYLVNNWLDWEAVSILAFSVIFALGYFAIWAVIYSIIKRNTDQVNKMLIKKQHADERFM